MGQPITSRAVAWRFLVEIQGVTVAEFTECNGLSVERETEPLIEGGRNDYVLQLPKRIKYTNITLKRGLIDNQLLDWLMANAESTIEPQPKDITIRLANESGQTAFTWTIIQAYPVKWNATDFKVDSNELVMETLEFAHMGFSMAKGA